MVGIILSQACDRQTDVALESAVAPNMVALAEVETETFQIRSLFRLHLEDDIGIADSGSFCF